MEDKFWTVNLQDTLDKLKTVQWVKRWSQANSLWPMPFGTACCAIELMATLASRYDLARFGAEVLRFSPRQSDVLIVAGRVSLKMMPVLMRIYRQMPEPKWTISVGACASCGGIFDNYATIQGIDRFIPVHVYVPGCPPRPESIIDAILVLQKKIRSGDTSPAKPPQDMKEQYSFAK